MDDLTLIERLGALNPPDPALTRERAAKTVAAGVRAAQAGTPPRRRRAWPRLVTAVAVALVALVSFSIFTAPGQAFTSWVW